LRKRKGKGNSQHLRAEKRGKSVILGAQKKKEITTTTEAEEKVFYFRGNMKRRPVRYFCPSFGGGAKFAQEEKKGGTKLILVKRRRGLALTTWERAKARQVREGGSIKEEKRKSLRKFFGQTNSS